LNACDTVSNNNKNNKDIDSNRVISIMSPDKTSTNWYNENFSFNKQKQTLPHENSVSMVVLSSPSFKEPKEPKQSKTPINNNVNNNNNDDDEFGS